MGGFSKLVAVAVLVAGAPVIAQDSAPLWMTLYEGDSPQAVADKLSAMDEVKRARVRERRGETTISISYRGDGIDLFDRSFEIVPQFEGGLTTVALRSESLCLGDAEQASGDLQGALQRKYPDQVVAQASSYERSRAISRTIEDEPTQLTSAFSDGQTVVLFQEYITKRDAPPYPYGARGTVATLAALAQSEYRAYVASCPNRGAYRSRLILIYMSREQFDAQMRRAGEAVEAETSSALDKL